MLSSRLSLLLCVLTLAATDARAQAPPIIDVHLHAGAGRVGDWHDLTLRAHA